MKTQIKPNSLADLEKQIQIRFTDQKLLETAFIHRSYLNEHKDFKGDSNERMEFLGDSVLSLIVSKFLFNELPKSTEGELTQIRASLVRTETLAFLSQNLHLGQYLSLAKGEEESGGRQSKTILANTFESLIGAIFLDRGIGETQKFIEKNILSNWKHLTHSAAADNKSKLQEILQRKYHLSPTYKLIKSWGPDHDRNFEVGVYKKEELLGSGLGKNKQMAAQNAAENAIARLAPKPQGEAHSRLKSSKLVS
ncbi:MAG: ribonuclease III [Candidatus Curtissbacteria bacterium]|nr:ribonuclease III [Candidatus Curtissbacteria bacterium]